MSAVKRFWELGLLYYLGVPNSVLGQLRESQTYSSEDEKKMAGLQYYLQTVPGASWRNIASVLWRMKEYTTLKAVKQYLPHKPSEYCMWHIGNRNSTYM